MNKQPTIEGKGFVIFQTWQTILIILGMVLAVGISYATARIDIDSLKERVTKLENNQKQLNRIEFNLQRVVEKLGMEYREFGNN